MRLNEQKGNKQMWRKKFPLKSNITDREKIEANRIKGQLSPRLNNQSQISKIA